MDNNRFSEEKEENPIRKAWKYIDQDGQEIRHDPSYHMSDAELAKKLGMTVEELNYLIAHPEDLKSTTIETLSDLTGLSLDELIVRKRKIQGPHIVTKSDELREKISLKEHDAKKAIQRLHNLEFISEHTEQIEAERSEIVQKLHNIIENLHTENRRLRVVAYGESDSGKSTLGNFLLNQKVFPEQYQPMTGIIAICHHISEKPSYLKENEDAVVIGTSGINRNITVDSLDLSEVGEGSIIKKGNREEILSDYGTKTGDAYQKNRDEISCIHVFLDNPNLKDITFYDVPGFSSGDIADDVAMKLNPASFDVFFYLSPANSFLNGGELAVVTQLMNEHADMDTFFIIATHADSVKDPRQANYICNSGASRIIKTLTQEQKLKLGFTGDGLDDLEPHILPSDIDNYRYCSRLNAKIEALIPELEYGKLSQAYSRTVAACKDCNDFFRDAGAKIEQKINSANAIDDEEARRQRAASSAKINCLESDLFDKIEEYKRSSTRKFNDKYDGLINADHIEQELKVRDIKNRKGEIQDFCTYLGNEVQDAMSGSVKEYSDQFNKDVDRAIHEYSDLWKKTDLGAIDISGSTEFDFTAAFAGGLTGVATFGALAGWAAVVAGGSNLGAYILIAKVVSALTAAGISVGSTASVAAAVSSIGGPVVLGITLAVIAAISVFSIVSGSWRKRLSEKIVKEYEKSNTRNNGIQNITKYWDDTREPLKKCFISMKEKAEKEYDRIINLRHQENNSNFKNALKKLYYEANIIFHDLATK